MTINYALSENIPLRDTSVWHRYTDIQTLKHGYGVITISPVQYDSQGKVWHLLDHASPGIMPNGVKLNGATYNSYKFYNEVDSVGHACAFLEVRDAADPGELSVTLQGKIHPVTGGLITNPADVIWDILNIARQVDDVSESDLDVYRRECTELGIYVAGVLDDHTRSTRSYLDEVALSTGSVQGGGMNSYARIFPREMPANEPIYQYFDDRNIDNVVPIADHTDLYTILRLLFDYDYSLATPQQVLQLECDSAIKDYGRVILELELKWIHSGRLASQIGERLLQYLARPRWKTSFDSELYVPSGGYVSFDNQFVPASGNVMILTSERTPMNPIKHYEIEMPVGSVPAVSITQQSAIYT